MNPTQSYLSPWVFPAVSTTNRFLLRHILFKSIRVEGQQYLPVHGPAVLAIKHYSRWDPLIIAQLETEAVRFMTNANQFSGLQGWLIMRLGAYAVDLARPQKSSIRETIDLLQGGKVVGIFPEGGIVRDQLLRPLKPGLARLILQAESTAKQPLSIPIIPVALHYTPAAQLGATVWVDVNPSFTSSQFSGDSEKRKAAQMTEHLETVLRDRLAFLKQQYPAA
jgi:1-acyl-sn-glycerol-3-phosphate acyltransferase